MFKFTQKTPFQSIILSALAHVAVVVLFILIKMHSEPAKTVEVFIQLSQPGPPPSVIMPMPQEKKEKPVVQKVLPAVTVPQREEQAPAEPEVVELDSITTDSVEKFDRNTFFAHAPQLHFKQPLNELAPDSTDTLQVLPFPSRAPLFPDFRDSTQFNVSPGPATDRVDRDLVRNTTGQAPTLPLGQAVGAGAKYLTDLVNKKKEKKTVRLDFVPTKVELDILQTIWDSTRATDTEIYAALDTSIRITAVDMTVVLEKLENKGLLKKKLVSPQNLFSFPLGQVEMSRKNRRNRVYQYETRIDADEVIRYLQAVLYETEHGKNALSDSLRTRQADNLREKIMRLLDGKS